MKHLKMCTSNNNRMLRREHATGLIDWCTPNASMKPREYVANTLRMLVLEPTHAPHAAKTIYNPPIVWCDKVVKLFKLLGYKHARIETDSVFRMEGVIICTLTIGNRRLVQ